jgi:hypothetical protein
MGRIINRIKKSKNTNKKIKNAKECIYNSIKFKSNLEKYCYMELEKSNIKFGYEEDKYLLVPQFIFSGEVYSDYDKEGNIIEGTNKVREMTFTPDFVGKEDNWIIECKGFMNDTFPLKWKLFKYYLSLKEDKHILFLPRNRKHVDQVIKIILNKFKTK